MENYYFEGNNIVFTEAHHRKRGFCCGSGCRHCCYDPKHQRGNTKMKNQSEIREKLQADFADIPLLFLEEEIYDSAIIGVICGKAHATAVAYDYEKVIEANVKSGMTYDEAIEYFDFNQVDAYMGDNTPVFMYKPV
jgi:hypothetical protein